MNAKRLKRAQNVLSGPQELRCQYGDGDENDDTLVLCHMFRTNKMLMMRKKIHVYVVQASPETTTARRPRSRMRRQVHTHSQSLVREHSF